MGHRAEKNRMRHGFKTTMIGCGQVAEYTTERPPAPGQHDNTMKGSRPWYKSLKSLTGWVKPNRDTWRPRHVKV